MGSLSNRLPRLVVLVSRIGSGRPQRRDNSRALAINKIVPLPAQVDEVYFPVPRYPYFRANSFLGNLLSLTRVRRTPRMDVTGLAPYNERIQSFRRSTPSAVRTQIDH